MSLVFVTFTLYSHQTSFLDSKGTTNAFSVELWTRAPLGELTAKKEVRKEEN